MRLRHIEVIQAILHNATLGASALALGLNEAALNQALQEAEQQLGFLLFSRVRGKLLPTRETLELASEFQRLQGNLERITRIAHALRQHQDPPLRVVCSATLAHQLLPHSLASLRRRFRETPCTLASLGTADIVRSLLLHESDLGLSLHDPQLPSIDSQPLYHGKLQLLAPHGWLSARQKYLTVQELAGQAMVGLEGEDRLSPALDRKLESLSPPPVMRTRVQTYQMMRSMVEAGEGLAIVDPFTAAGAAGLDVCPLSPAVPVTLYALTLAGRETCAAGKTLLELISEQSARMLG